MSNTASARKGRCVRSLRGAHGGHNTATLYIYVYTAIASSVPVHENHDVHHSEDELEPDMRPHRSQRCHLAEFYDDDDAQGDLLGTDQPPQEFAEPPSEDEL